MWEGNRESGVAQAMRHRFSTYGLKGLKQGDEPVVLWTVAPLAT